MVSAAVDMHRASSRWERNRRKRARPVPCPNAPRTASHRQRNSSQGLLALVVLLTSLATSCAEREWVVTPGPPANQPIVWPDGTGDYPTIQAALDAAAPGDTINLAAGTFAGEGNRDLDFHGKPVVLQSWRGDVADCVIDCEGTANDPHGGFVFSSGEGPQSVVKDITITHANTYRSGAVSCRNRSRPTLVGCILTSNLSEFGGAALCCEDSSSVTLQRCTISHNTSTECGGAVYCFQSAPTFIGCCLLENSCGQGGGGSAYCTASSPSFTNCTFSTNATAGVGGAVYLTGSAPRFVNCRLLGNSSTEGYGGAVYATGSVPIFTDCTFSDNSASESGGALCCEEGEANASVSLTDCVLSGNSAGDSTGHGGAVYCAGNAIPCLTDCDFSNNSAYCGGGVYCTGGASVCDSAGFRHCTFTDNRALDLGGAVYVQNVTSPVFLNCTLDRNSAGGRGGGIICVSSSPVLRNCAYAANTAGIGGAMAVEFEAAATPELTDCTFSRNTANTAGALSCWEAAPMVRNSAFVGNSADSVGGAVACYEGSAPSFNGCTFASNAAPLGGAVACWDGGSPTLVGCTLYDNASPQGGAILCWNQASPQIERTIIAFSTEGAAVHCLDESYPALTCCDLYGNQNGDWIGCVAHLLGTVGNISAHPRFYDAHNGDFSLWSSSPCAAENNYECGLIGAWPVSGIEGDVTAPGAVGDLTVGRVTPFSVEVTWTAPGDDEYSGTVAGYEIRLGAEEVTGSNWDTAAQAVLEGPVVPVPAGSLQSVTLRDLRSSRTYHIALRARDDVDNWSVVSNSVPATTPHAGYIVRPDGTGDFATIQQAIQATADGDTVILADGTYTGDGNRGIDFLGKAITLRSQSGDPETCIIDCECDYYSRHRGLLFQSSEGPGTAVEGISVTHACSDDCGAVYCIGASPRLSRCVFVGNWGSTVGGILCDASAPTLVACTIAGNQGDAYGGLYCRNGSAPSLITCTISGNQSGWAAAGLGCDGSSPTLTDCVISDNSTDNGSGGGMSCQNGSAAVLQRCSFSRNAAGYGGGGGLMCADSSPSLERCTFSENTAATQPQSSGGGGVYCVNASPTLHDCAFSGNSAPYSSGGGVDCRNSSSPELLRCGLSGNSAGSGGGLACDNASNPILTGCEFQGNSAWNGGGIQCQNNSKPVLNGCLLVENQAASAGGGLACWSSNPEIHESTFARNTAPNEGAGVYCAQASPVFTQCLFFDNAVSGAGGTAYGGALRCSGSHPVLTQCTFTGNSVRTEAGGWACQGGAISFLDGSWPTLTNCTLSDNATIGWPDAAGGIHCAGSFPTLNNTIIAFSTEGRAVTCVDGAQATLNCCDVYGNAGGDWTDWIASQAEVNGNINEDPLFRDRPSRDFTLWSVSPCAPEHNAECGLIGASEVGGVSAEDLLPPDRVTNMVTGDVHASSVALQWIAPGDDRAVGTAFVYDVRYAQFAITEGNWDVALQAEGEPEPAVAGSEQEFVVSGLELNTEYYFAMKTGDEVPNWSRLSNVVSAKTAECDDCYKESFELGASAWTVSSAGGTQFTVTDEYAHTGWRSFQAGPSYCFSDCWDAYTVTLERNFTPSIEPGARISLWVYETFNLGGQVVVRVNGTQVILADPIPNNDPNQPGWVRYEATVGEALQSVSVYCRDLTIFGAVYVDDILIEW